MIKMRHRSKFCGDRLYRYRNIAISQIFKMAAVRRLGFLIVRNFNRR